MKLLLKYLLIFNLSFTPIVYFFYGPILINTGLYFNFVFYLLITLLGLYFIQKNRNINKYDLISIVTLLIIILSIPFFRFINGSINDSVSTDEASRFLIWACISIIILLLDKSNFNFEILLKSGYIYILWVLISLVCFFYFNDYYMLLYNLASKNDAVTTVMNFESDEALVRFFIPGLNANTVVILSIIYFVVFYTSLKNRKKKVLISLIEITCLFFLLISIFLTYSRMAFTFLFIILLVEIFLNKDKLLPKLLIPVLIIATFLNNTIYFRLLNTIDSIFGSTYSEGKTNSSSERTNLINDSLDWILHNPLGGSFSIMAKSHPGAAGEHLLYLYITNNYGIILGVVFFFFTIYFVWKDYLKIRRNKLSNNSIPNSLFAIQLVLFSSCFVAPSYYIQFLFFPIISKAITLEIGKNNMS